MNNSSSLAWNIKNIDIQNILIDKQLTIHYISDVYIQQKDFCRVMYLTY